MAARREGGKGNGGTEGGWECEWEKATECNIYILTCYSRTTEHCHTSPSSAARVPTADWGTDKWYSWAVQWGYRLLHASIVRVGGEEEEEETVIPARQDAGRRR